MKRYKITQELKRSIKNSQYSLRNLSNILGFEVKNICNKNISIREDHLKKLTSILNLNLSLKEINFDYAKNLGICSLSQPIKSIKKGPKLAEFIGIMLGDGNIYGNRVKISLDKRNINYTTYIENLFQDIFDIKLKKQTPEKTNQMHLYCYNKNITLKLLKLGLKRGNKIKNKVKIPEWIKENKTNAKRCIKGLIDTDGCIYICKREKQRYIKFTNHNQVLLNDFKKITKDIGYSFAKSNKTNICLYRKAEVVRFINSIKPLKSIYGIVG